MEKKKEARSYQEFYLKEYGFEAEMVAARQRVILEELAWAKPRRVLEIGCGPVLLYDRACRKKIPIHEWVMVDPCEAFTKKVRRKNIPLLILSGFFEKEIDKIQAIVPQGFDFVICSGMLNEVRHPARFLRRVKKVLAKNGVLHINVPNAGSLHRRLGVAAGLIKRPHQIGRRNRQLMQYHVFSEESLRKVVRQGGFKIKSSGGYFMKPFSHAQMQAIGPKVLTRRVLEGLWQLGRQYPELATEIYVNAKLG